MFGLNSSSRSRDDVRRVKARDRWARYNAKRDADTTEVPRGSDADTTTSVPSAPSVPPGLTGPSSPNGARAQNDDGQKPRNEERRRALDHLSEEYKAGRLSELDYQRQRKDVAS